MIDHRELTPVKLLYTVKNRKEFILAGFMFFSILQRFYRWIAIDQVVLWFILIAFALLWLRLEKWGRSPFPNRPLIARSVNAPR